METCRLCEWTGGHILFKPESGNSSGPFIEDRDVLSARRGDPLMRQKSVWERFIQDSESWDT